MTARALSRALLAAVSFVLAIITAPIHVGGGYGAWLIEVGWLTALYAIVLGLLLWGLPQLFVLVALRGNRRAKAQGPAGPPVTRTIHNTVCPDLHPQGWDDEFRMARCEVPLFWDIERWFHLSETPEPAPREGGNPS